MRTTPCGMSGCAIRNAAALTISATPALSSAPSSVVPDAVTMSWPICAASAGLSASRRTAVRIVGQDEVAAVVARVDDGHDVRAAHFGRRVHVRDESDRRHCRSWSSSPGPSPSRSRARRAPRRASPSAVSSSTSSRWKTSCVAVLGTGRRALVRPRVEPHVAQEAFENVAHVRFNDSCHEDTKTRRCTSFSPKESLLRAFVSSCIGCVDCC